MLEQDQVVDTHVSFALTIEVSLDIQAANHVSQVTIDVVDTHDLTCWTLFPAIEYLGQTLLSNLKSLIQVVDSIANKSPKHIVCHSPERIDECVSVAF